VVVHPRFDPVQFYADIEKHGITIARVVPPILVVLARHDGGLLEFVLDNGH